MLEGNPLDMVVDGSMNSLIVSLDCAHEPGSTSQPRRYLNAAMQLLQRFSMKDSKWVGGGLRFKTRSHEGVIAGEDDNDDLGSLSSLLYNLETLRKRGGEE